MNTQILLRKIVFGIVALFVLAATGVNASANQTGDEIDPMTSPVGVQLSWLMDELNTGAVDLDEATVTEHFGPALLAKVGAEGVVSLVQSWVPYGPFTLQGFTRTPTETQANAFGQAVDGTPVVLPIAVEQVAPHRITGMNLAPVPPPAGLDLTPVVGLDGSSNAEPGRIDGLFDAGNGRQVYLSCVGTGGPTVVLEAGDNDLAASWFAVERAVASFGRVCSYDRANSSGSASDEAPLPRSGVDVVADLHAVLAANVPGPYVFVGHSDGGLYAWLYAHTYPDEVAGLVLVDTPHEDYLTQLEALVGPELWAPFAELIAQDPNLDGLDYDATVAEVRAARATNPLPPMPLLVVVAGVQPDASAYPAGWPVEAHHELKSALQSDLAGQVPGGRLVVAEQSGHYVHQFQPEVVVEAIKQVVDAVRDPSTWNTEATPVAQ